MIKGEKEKRKEDLWDRYYMGAPERRRQCVERYKREIQESKESIMKLAKKYLITANTVRK